MLSLTPYTFVLEHILLMQLNTKKEARKSSKQIVILSDDNLLFVPKRRSNHIGDVMKVGDHRQLKVKLEEIRNSSSL